MSIDYRAIFESSTNPYMLLDRGLRFVDANAAYLALTAKRLDELVGRGLFEVFPHEPDAPDNDSQRQLRASLLKVLATRERDVLAHITYRVPRVPGGEPEERIWSATHTPILDAAGEVALILQHTEDVTALHRAPEAAKVLVRAAEVQRHLDVLGGQTAALRAMLEQAPGFFAFLRGPTHVFEVANRAYVRLVGRSVLGKPVREALPDIVDQGYLELLDRVYATGEPFVGRGMRVELANPTRPEPEEAYLDFVYQPVAGPDGRTLGIVVQGHEVTDQRRTADRQEFLTRASECLVTSPDDVDAALCRVAEIAVQTIADWAFVDLYREAHTDRLAVAARRAEDAAIARAMTRFPSPRTLPATHAFADRSGAVLVADFDERVIAGVQRGEEYGELLRASRIRSVISMPLWYRGQLYGMFAIATATRRFTAADLPTVEELGRIAGAAIDSARLDRERGELLVREQVARERAEAANRAKDDFLAMLGHELRNPLAPVLTALQLWRLRSADGTVPREVEIIERQVGHMVRLVDDLLDVARITRGKIQLRLGVVELADVAAKAVEIVAPHVALKRHDLTVDVPAGLHVRGDDARLTQVLANLLTNAVRYTEAGGRIELTAARDGDSVVIRVRDDGMGIAPEVLPHVFEQFVQAPQAPHRAEGGLGLGLTLVQGIVAMHGGTVEARSAGLGQGTELVVRLPRLAGPLPAAPPAEAEPPAPAGLSILVVDDNVDAAVLLGELLERSGHHVTVVHDGLEALARATADRPQVAVIDIGLPGLDGYELAARLAIELGDQAPHMIALTGYGSERDRERGLAAGFAVHLTKPVSSSALLALLERAPTAQDFARLNTNITTSSS